MVVPTYLPNSLHIFNISQLEQNHSGFTGYLPPSGSETGLTSLSSQLADEKRDVTESRGVSSSV